jgi:hypothetical protein
VLRLLVMVLFLAVVPAQARPALPTRAPLDAFVIEAPGQPDTLIVQNLLTGETWQEPVTGARYSIVGDSVVFFDESSGRVMQVGADGVLREHPLIQPPAGARRIDWTWSPAPDKVAWTVTEGSPDALTTTTYMAAPDGAGARLVWRDGPRSGIRAYPVGFSEDGTTLYMDYQPDTIADLAPLQQYAALFALDVTSGAASSLPGEPGCYCGGALAAGRFLRLALASAGFDVNLFELTSSARTVIPSLGYPDYTQAGDALIAPDGSKAIYTLLQFVVGGAPGETRALYVVADLVNGRQRALNAESPDDRLLRPVAWTEDGAAVLMRASDEPGTWRLNVASGEVARVADATFIGTTATNAAAQ